MDGGEAAASAWKASSSSSFVPLVVMLLIRFLSGFVSFLSVGFWTRRSDRDSTPSGREHVDFACDQYKY
jgi:hypothetical protein